MRDPSPAPGLAAPPPEPAPPAPSHAPAAPHPSDAPAVSPGLAGALTFLAAACVLVLEIAAARLLAPYVGVSLTTYTAIIGIILAGIAFGAWVGGRLADARPPAPLVGPVIALGGVAAIAAVPLVAAIGPQVTGGGAVPSIVLAGGGFVLPAAILSAAAPMLVRATIRDVATSGGLVGRLSAIGTAGALTGTFLTGFVLLGTFPTRGLIVATGGLLVAVGVVVGWYLRPGRPRTPHAGGPRAGGRGAGIALALVVATALATSALAAASPSPCDRESAYYCIAVREDSRDPSRRTLILDNLRHAFVDLDDPTAIEFAYIRWFRGAAGLAAPTAGLAAPTAGLAAPTPADDSTPGLDVVHVGGGGFAFPRYLRAVVPTSRHVVLELDPAVLDIARSELGFAPDPAIDVRLGDARGTLGTVPDGSADIVIGDAFGGLSVPWHLTTREFVADIDRVLRPGGRYVVNVIDGPELRLARAKAATLLDRFAYVAVATWRDAFDGLAGGNAVLVASHVAFDVAAFRSGVEAGDPTATVIHGDAVRAFASGAPVLTDDFAPADQLLGR